MKYQETQPEMIQSYQKIYDAIVQKTWERKTAIFGSAETGYGIPDWSTLNQDERVTAIENLINSQVQSREYQLLITCSWRLDLPCGSEILSEILQLSNESYDFNGI